MNTIPKHWLLKAWLSAFCLLLPALAKVSAQEYLLKVGKAKNIDVDICENIEVSRLKDRSYRDGISKRFAKGGYVSISQSFAGNDAAVDAVTDLYSYAARTSYTSFKRAVDNVSRISGVPADWLQTTEATLLNIVTVKAEFSEAHAYCAVCMLGDKLHQRYIEHPDEAPSDQREFYQKLSGSGGNTGNTSSPEVQIGEAVIPKKYLWYAGGLMLGLLLISTLLTAWLVARKNRNRMRLEDVLNSPQLQQLIQQQSHLQQQQVLNAVSQEFTRQQQQIQQLTQSLSDVQAKNAELQKIATHGGGGGNVDSAKLNKVLTDFLERITKLEQGAQEQSQKSLATKEGIRLTPQELSDWILSHPDVKEALKQSLDVVTLHDLIVRLLPNPLNLKDLDDLERETLNRQWRLFCQRNEFLPNALGQFRQQLLNELRNNQNKIY